MEAIPRAELRQIEAGCSYLIGYLHFHAKHRTTISF